ncbi:MAG: phosphotransferase [Candidatus Vidania fulgoroideorum]
MAYYTKINKNILFKIFSLLIGRKPLLVKGVSQGTDNSNYKIVFFDFVFYFTLVEKVYKRRNISKIVSFMFIVFYNNIKSIKLFFFNCLNLYKSKFFCISNEILGKNNVFPNKYKCFYLGKELSKIHNLNVFFKKNNNFSLKGIFSVFKHNYKLFFEKFYFLFFKLSYLILNFKYIDMSFCHCDIFKDNVFFVGNKLGGIIDYYFSCSENVIYDISIVIFEWCFFDCRFLFKNFKYFLFGYLNISSFDLFDVFVFLNYYLKFVSFRFFITRLIANLNNSFNFKCYSEYLLIGDFFCRNLVFIIKFFYKYI